MVRMGMGPSWGCRRSRRRGWGQSVRHSDRYVRDQGEVFVNSTA